MMVVLKALYAVNPIPELLAELTPTQQLQAAVLADMWQVPQVTEAAVKMLIEAWQRPRRVGERRKALKLQKFLQTDSSTAAELQISLHNCLTCLLPLFSTVMIACTQAVPQQLTAGKGLLLSVLGDLEAVWADEALKKTLLALPLPAMAALLKFDELKVASEDTVLYVVREYIDNAATTELKQAAAKQLAPLIRCPHLSHYWLSALAVLEPASMQVSALLCMLLTEGLRSQARELLMLRQADPSVKLAAETLKQKLPNAPPSWLLAPRVKQQLSNGVQLRWSVAVSKIKEAAQSSAQQHKRVDLLSHSATPPMGGVDWKLQLSCDWKEAKQGSTVGLFATPNNLPAGMYCQYSFTIGCEEYSAAEMSAKCLCAHGWGWPDFFNLGPMAGGWDEAAWVAEGLPTSGEVVFTLHVTEVGHAQD